MALASPPPPDGTVERPRRSLVAAIIIREQCLLLVENIKYGIRLEFPGGKVEPDEDLIAAILREIMEEIGCEAEILGRMADFETESQEGQFIVHNLICAIRGEPQEGREPKKIGKIRWYAYAELQALAAAQPCLLAPNVVAMLQEFAPLLGAEAAN